MTNTIKPSDRLFEDHRGRLLSIGYRMLGSFTEAEDVVQDAYLRWSGQWRRRKLSDIDNVAAFLTSVVTRICLDRLRHRKVERLGYVGPWLPEPVPFGDEALNQNGVEAGDRDVDARLVEDKVSQLESVNTALLVVLESLSPLQRAVFTLSEVFDYRHQEIADLLDITVVYSRQLLRRAKCDIAKRKVPESTPAGKSEEPVFRQFFEAFVSGDNTQLESVLCDDVIAYSDGGGKASAALIPLVGVDRVSTVFGHILKNLSCDAELVWQSINGQLGLLIREEGRVNSVTTFDMKGDKIIRIYAMRNPDKLRMFTQI